MNELIYMTQLYQTLDSAFCGNVTFWEIILGEARTRKHHKLASPSSTITHCSLQLQDIEFSEVTKGFQDWLCAVTTDGCPMVATDNMLLAFPVAGISNS